MESIGIDVHKVNRQVCVVDEHGEIVQERRIRTDRERVSEVVGKRHRARVLIEASTESEWVLGQKGFELLPNHTVDDSVLGLAADVGPTLPVGTPFVVGARSF